MLFRFSEHMSIHHIFLKAAVRISPAAGSRLPLASPPIVDSALPARLQLLSLTRLVFHVPLLHFKVTPESSWQGDFPYPWGKGTGFGLRQTEIQPRALPLTL